MVFLMAGFLDRSTFTSLVLLDGIESNENGWTKNVRSKEVKK